MTPEQKQLIKSHADATCSRQRFAIAEILYDDCNPESLKTLEDIEITVKDLVLSHVTPQIGFFIGATSETKAGRIKTLKSTLGDLIITEKQADKLGGGSSSRLSPHLENCCLRLSANVAYKNAAQDIEYITGISVSAKIQQRLVHYQEFKQPIATIDISELSADGGKARLITPKGEKSEWKDYKAIVAEVGIIANFDRNATIIDWANEQPLAKPLTCLGNGHDGV
jgi:hypothetical protein